jgi:type I restriction enzyme S subunit
MAGEYPSALLGDVAAVRSGFAFKSSDWIDSGVPVVKITNVKDGRLVMDGCSFVSPEVAVSAAEFHLQTNDILIAMTGYIGDVALVRQPDLPAILNQRVGRFAIRDKHRLERGFLFYLLRSPKIRSEIEGLGYGSAQPNVSPSLIHGVEVSLPPLPEQRAIAHVLGALDDKIELNRRMNETLEAITQALFKSWFVDATQDGLPEGWRESTIGELCEFAYGKSLKEEIRRPGSIPVYGSNGQVGWHDEALVKGPGIVIGRKGNPGIVTWVPTDFFSIDTTFYVVPKGACRSLYFLFHALRTHNLAALGADSAVPGLNRNMAYMSEQAVPPSNLLDTFDKQVRPLFERIQCNAEESRVLAALRDTLLPKLISGELRIKGAERFIEEVRP